jgi:hypothetical protein
MKIPARLSRKAVKQFFDKVPSPKWDYWFRHEKENGLFELRVKGPFEKAYYAGEGIKEWLLTEGTYSPRDFEDKSATPQSWFNPVIRKHALAV